MAYNGDTTHYNGTNVRQHTLQGTTITHNGVQWRHKALQWDRCATTYLARLLRNIRRFLMVVPHTIVNTFPTWTQTGRVWIYVKQMGNTAVYQITQMSWIVAIVNAS